jgi:cell division protein FtsW (lipid II flippase)
MIGDYSIARISGLTSMTKSGGTEFVYCCYLLFVCLLNGINYFFFFIFIFVIIFVIIFFIFFLFYFVYVFFRGYVAPEILNDEEYVSELLLF